MSNISIGHIDIPMDAGLVIDVELPEGTTVIGTQVMTSIENPLLVSPGMQLKIEYVPRMIVAVDPEAPRRMYKFLIIPHGRGVKTEDELEFRALFANDETGAVIAIYEVVSATMTLQVGDRTCPLRRKFDTSDTQPEDDPP